MDKEAGHIGAGAARIALPITPVIVRGFDSGQRVRTQALLDTGSTNTFCTEDLLRQLNVQGQTATMSLTTLECQRNSRYARS
jgi:predicted aspartyl protease